MITNALLSIAAILLLINLLAPLLIWRSQRLPARVALAPVDEPGFLAARSARFRELEAGLRELGASHLASSRMTLQAVTTHFSVYTLDDGRTVATLQEMAGADQQVVYLEFSRLYQDGSVLDVNNSPVSPAFPDIAVKIMARLPEIQTPDALYAVFCRLAESLHNTAPVATIRERDCFRVIETFIRKESDELVRLGYCHREIDTNGHRRPTLKGAYLMTWGQIFPGSWLRKHRDARYARKLLQAS